MDTHTEHLADAYNALMECYEAFEHALITTEEAIECAQLAGLPYASNLRANVFPIIERIYNPGEGRNNLPSMLMIVKTYIENHTGELANA